jgi:hypothetical protein
LVSAKEHIINPAAGTDTKEYNLSLLIGTDRFSCLIYHPINHIFYDFRLYAIHQHLTLEAQYLAILMEDEIFKQDFNVVKIGLSIFEEAKTSPVLSIFQQEYPRATILNIKEQLDIAFQQKAAENDGIFSFWQGTNIYICSIKNGKKISENNYNYKKAEDALYFLLLNFHQGQFSTLEVPLYVCGDLLKASTVYKLLHIYIKEIYFLENPSKMEIPLSDSDFHEHIYFDIFSTAL